MSGREDRDVEDGGEKGRERSIVSIRGVDKELYRRVSTIAKELDKTVGEVVNEALDLFIRLTDEASDRLSSLVSKSYIVKGLDRLRVSGEELRVLERPVIFAYIGELELTGLDDEALERIVKIHRVDRLRVSGSFNRIKLYSRLSNVGEVVEA